MATNVQYIVYKGTAVESQRRMIRKFVSKFVETPTPRDPVDVQRVAVSLGLGMSGKDVRQTCSSAISITR
jgi:hypothetical protein